jgi:hypothetical protein
MDAFPTKNTQAQILRESVNRLVNLKYYIKFLNEFVEIINFYFKEKK